MKNEDKERDEWGEWQRVGGERRNKAKKRKERWIKE